MTATFERMRSLPEAVARVAALSGEGARFQLIAGGTDLVVESHLGAHAPALYLDVSSVPELARIEDRGDTLRFGGGVTYLALRRDPIAARVPLLGAMARDVGALQIQARGTLGGNIATASPAADGVCALYALDAVVGLVSSAGERAIPITELYEGYKKSKRRPDELIAWIDVRVPSATARWQWRKVGTRLAQAISKVALAAVIEQEGGTIVRARCGMASVGPTTSALPSVRAALEGKASTSIDPSAIEAAVARDIAPIDDVRSTGAYRLHVGKSLVRELVRSLGSSLDHGSLSQPETRSM